MNLNLDYLLPFIYHTRIIRQIIFVLTEDLR